MVENFVSNLLQLKIVNACKSICEHIKLLSKDEFSIKRISLLFKVDKNDKLALILCTNLKVQINPRLIVRTFTRHADPYIWTTKFTTSRSEILKSKKELDHNIRSIFSPTKHMRRSISNMKKGVAEHCIFCLKNTSERWCNVKYKQIIDMYTHYKNEIPKPLKTLNSLAIIEEYRHNKIQESWLTNTASCCSTCYYLIRDLYFILILNSSKQNYKNDPSVWNNRLKLILHKSKSKSFLNKRKSAPSVNKEATVRNKVASRTSRNSICNLENEWVGTKSLEQLRPESKELDKQFNSLRRGLLKVRVVHSKIRAGELVNNKIFDSVESLYGITANNSSHPKVNEKLVLVSHKNRVKKFLQ